MTYESDQYRDREGAARCRSMSGPNGYLITFRTYGTWLHGDSRGSVDRNHNTYRTPTLAANARRRAIAQKRLTQGPVSLNETERAIVHRAIEAVCRHREWVPAAINVRSNHVHVVVSVGDVCPVDVLGAMKSWATRRLREAGHIVADAKVWSRHGSTKYLWRSEDVLDACRYVVEQQG